MSDQPAGPQTVESDEALFDIVVQLATGSTIERVKDKAINDLGMEPAKVEALARALQSGPSARIGSAVPKSRAEKARDDFTKAGLKVTLSPVLSISKMTAAESDGKTVCPACNARVILPENRQCPACNVFVDKVDEQFLLRKKLMEQERRRAEMALDRDKKATEKANKEAMEREMREQIRKEIEAEMGISDGNGGGASLATKVKMGVAVLGVAGIAFFGGKMAGGGGGDADPTKSAGAKGGAANAISASAQSVAGGVTKGADIDQVMQNLPSAGTLDPAAAELLDDAAAEEAMLKSARNGGPNAKGIPMDQALAASMTLAEAAGNSTAQRALSGASGPAGAGAAVAQAGAAAGAKPFVAAPLPADFKPLLALELADQLAYMGQSVRARGIVREIQATPNPTPALSAAVLMSEVIVNAWGLSSATAEKSRKLMEAVKAGIAAMREPSEKAKAASATAIAIAAQSRTPEQTAQPFLVQAAEAAAQVTDATQKQVATDHLLIASGHVLLGGVTTAARQGNFERANDLATRLQNSAKQARTPLVSAQIHAMVHLARAVTSPDTSAAQSLDVAISEALRSPGLAEKAAAIQAVAEIVGVSATPKLQQALQGLEAAAASATGLAQIQASGAMSAAFAAVGDEARAEFMRTRIATASGVPPAEQQMEMGKALLRADFALARFQQKAGAYAQSENTVMRAASYLFAKGK